MLKIILNRLQPQAEEIIAEEQADMIEILLMVFLAEDPEIEYLSYGAPSRSETSLLFCILKLRAKINLRGASCFKVFSCSLSACSFCACVGGGGA